MALTKVTEPAINAAELLFAEGPEAVMQRYNEVDLRAG